MTRGLGYLALDPEESALSFLRGLAEARIRFLWMTSSRQASMPDGGDTLRVTTVRAAFGTADPRRLQDLRSAVTTFFDEYGSGAIVVDCLDSLMLHSGIERVLRFVHDLHEEVALRDASLVVFADSSAVNRRMIAWLERELDPLPRVVKVVGAGERLA